MRWRTLLLATLAGCSLFSKAPPLEITYFEPRVTAGETRAEPTDVKIRLGRVSLGGHLRSRVAYRTSRSSIELYEGRRWAEPPSEYVQRALEQELVRRGALVTGGRALELDVEVIAFEEVRSPAHAGRVVLRYMLVDDRDVIREGVVEAERPAGADFESVVTAIGEALDQASRRVVAEAIRSAA